MIILYVLIFILCFILMEAYIRLAHTIGIVDVPNKRSSHHIQTIRGGGIVFVFASLFGWILGSIEWPLMFAIAFGGAVGFADDISPLSIVVRIIVHIVSLWLVFYGLKLLDVSWWWLLMVGVLFIGWVNTVNFMDGINGITALYSLVSLITLTQLEPLSHLRDFYLIIIIALLVFSYYNVRRRAIVFAGDIGSISIAIILGFSLIELISYSNNWQYMLLVAVYGIDSVITIVVRLLNGENIFRPHRSHLYQLFSNELEQPQIRVSVAYAFIQLVVNTIVIVGMQQGWLSDRFAISLFVFLLLSYLSVRYMVTSRI